MTATTDPFDLARAEAMLHGYDARWADEMARYEVLFVEREFTTQLVNPLTRAPSRTWRLAGKLDAGVRELASGRELIVEHKSASGDVSPGSDYIRRLRLDPQVSIYFDGAKAIHLDPEACLYDVLSKPLQRPSQVALVDDQGVKIVLDAGGQRVKTKDGKKFRETGDAAQGYVLQTRLETADEYFHRLIDAIASDPTGYFTRVEVVRHERELEEAQLDAWQLGKQIRESDVAGRYPRNPDACVRYGTTCAFFDVCTGVASLEDESRFVRAEDVHPELSIHHDQPGKGFDLLTSSRLSSARACQRLHHLRYGKGYRPAVESEALRFGSLIHLGLEAWWCAPQGARLEAALAALHPLPGVGQELAVAGSL